MELDADIASRIFAAYEEAAAPERRSRRLGASELGQPCERRLWLSFRWAARERFGGRMRRLFDTGKREEVRLVLDLRRAGYGVRDADPATERQYDFTFSFGHAGGCADGLIRLGNEWRVLEVKTHNDKSFAELVKKGVAASKPIHLAQVQVYLGLARLDRALYLAVNKNTDDIHAEVVAFDADAFAALREKARRVVFAERPAARVAASPDAQPCRFCPFATLCFQVALEQTPERSCRTCLHSTPVEGGGWRCEKHGRELSHEDQLAGCERHLYVPDLLPWRVTDAAEDRVEYECAATGRRHVNREGGAIE